VPEVSLPPSTLICHEPREVNEHGVQNCRRCGLVLADLAFPNHTAFDKRGAFQPIGSGTLYGPVYFTDDERRDAVSCPWIVH